MTDGEDPVRSVVLLGAVFLVKSQAMASIVMQIDIGGPWRAS